MVICTQVIKPLRSHAINWFFSLFNTLHHGASPSVSVWGFIPDHQSWEVARDQRWTTWTGLSNESPTYNHTPRPDREQSSTRTQHPVISILFICWYRTTFWSKIRSTDQPLTRHHHLNKNISCTKLYSISLYWPPAAATLFSSVLTVPLFTSQTGL